MEPKSMLFIIFLILLSSTLFSQPADSLSDVSAINLKTYIEKDEVPQNGEVIYQVELNWDGPLNRLDIEQIDEPLTTNLKLRSSGSSNKFYQDEQGTPHSVKKITYYFTPVEMGMAYIEGVIVKYKDVRLDQSSSLMAQRLSVKIIAPLRESGSNMFKANSILWLITIIFSITIAYFLYRYFQRKSRAQQEEAQQVKSLEDKYLELLHETIHPGGESPDDNLSALVRLFRSYLAEKTGKTGISILDIINDPEWSERFKNDIKNKLSALYEQSELIKFAGESLSQSNFHMYYDTVEMFLKNINDDEVKVSDGYGT